MAFELPPTLYSVHNGGKKRKEEEKKTMKRTGKKETKLHKNGEENCSVCLYEKV